MNAGFTYLFVYIGGGLYTLDDTNMACMALARVSVCLDA